MATQAQQSNALSVHNGYLDSDFGCLYKARGLFCLASCHGAVEDGACWIKDCSWLHLEALHASKGSLASSTQVDDRNIVYYFSTLYFTFTLHCGALDRQIGM